TSGVRGEQHDGVAALLGRLQEVVRVAEIEHRLAGRDRVDDAGAAAGHVKPGRQAEALLLEELLLTRDQVLAVDERRDAVRDRDRLCLFSPAGGGGGPRA